MSKPGYPVWWETTITIYNQITDAQTSVVSWFRTVVTDCFWKLTGTQVQIGDTVLDAKSITCRIPKDERFLPRKDWVKLPNDEKANHFTLTDGDIIVEGECLDEIDEYTAGHRSTDLLGKYREYEACMEVTEFGINTGTGKNNEHYVARGK